MKFMVLYKKNPEVVEYFNRHSGKQYGNGADLKILKTIRIDDSEGRPTGKEGYAFCCTGPLWSYLWHKINFEYIERSCSVIRGWF